MALKINGRVIPPQAIEFELNRLVKFYAQHMSMAEVKKQMPVLRRRAKDQAIGSALLMEESIRLDIPVPAEEIDAVLNKMIENAGGIEPLNKMLQTQGMNMPTLMQNIQGGKKIDKLIEKITADIPDPSSVELREHFEAHAKEYRTSDRVNARHILIKADSDSASDKATARSRLNEICARIKEGAAFSDEASAHSDCPSGKQAGGSLGWFSRGMMIPEFDQKVFSMKDGELSDPLETQFGYHIIERIGFEEGGNAAFEDVEDNIRDFLRHARRGEMISQYVDDLRSKASIEDDKP